MTIGSTGRLRGWRCFCVAIVAGALGPGLLAACSGSKPSGSGRPPTGPTGSTAHVVLVPRSIDATGRDDVTDALDALIARVPDGSIVRFRAGGRYRVEGTLFVRNRRRITFDGRGATVFATTRGGRDRAQWWVKRGRHIVFRDLVVRGANPRGGVSERAYVPKLESQHGFRLEAVNGVELDHVRVTDVYGDFVYVGRDKHRRPSRNVWIHDSVFRRNGRQGVAVTAGTNVIIERNNFGLTRRATIDLEPNGHSWHVSKVFVLHNTVGRGRLLFVASHGQGEVNDVVISGNVLRGHDLTIDVLPPESERRSNWVVTNNVSNTTVHHRPMRFFSIDGLLVRGNTQRVSGNQPGVIVTDDCGAHVSDNEFGGGGVRRSGARCTAPLAVPEVPAILGRGGRRSPTTTTTPSSSGVPGSSTPAATAAPASAPGASGSGDAGAWVALGIGAGLLLAVVIVVRARRRRGGAGGG